MLPKALVIIERDRVRKLSGITVSERSNTNKYEGKTPTNYHPKEGRKAPRR